jgi:antitoxin PrlF
MPHTVTVKGQVLVPKEIREKTGILPGTRVEWDIDAQGRAVMSKAVAETPTQRQKHIQAAIAAARGSLRDSDAFPGMSTDEFMVMVRDPLP